MRLDQPLDLVSRGQHGDDRLAGGHFEFVQRVEVERVAGRHDQHALALMDREQGLAVHEPGREAVQIRRLDLHLRQIDERQAQLVTQSLQRRLLGDKAQLHGHLVQSCAVRLGPSRYLELPVVDKSFLQQDLASFHHLLPLAREPTFRRHARIRLRGSRRTRSRSRRLRRDHIPHSTIRGLPPLRPGHSSRSVNKSTSPY